LLQDWLQGDNKAFRNKRLHKQISRLHKQISYSKEKLVDYGDFGPTRNDQHKDATEESIFDPLEWWNNEDEESQSPAKKAKTEEPAVIEIIKDNDVTEKLMDPCQPNLTDAEIKAVYDQFTKEMNMTTQCDVPKDFYLFLKWVEGKKKKTKK
jgi:hypothetical protein